jgi:T4-like virus Myoviridae tail sheath stabiliser
MAQIQYNRIIRKIVVGFGNLFNDITLVRFNPDNSEAERFLVPIAYATKEFYVRRLEEDYNADKKIQMALPRMSFEMSGLSYDSSRKLNTNIKNFGLNNNGDLISQYNPVPYNFDFNLYLYVRNVEDGTQIIEHIIPYFTPDYTIKLNLIPELGIIKEVPIILNSTSSDITFEGNRDSETRTIIWTLNFTVKGFIFGNVSETGSIIKTSITNIYNDISPDDIVAFNMTNPGIGEYQIGEIVYQGFTYKNSTATAKVVSWNNNILELTDVQGNFVSNQPVYGMNTNANYSFNSYNLAGSIQTKFAEITVTPNPSSANANSDYTYTETISE